MELNNLIETIKKANKDYYTSGHTDLSDSEYDSLKGLLEQKDPTHPLLASVGNTPSDLWVKAEHDIAMGSLNKVNTLNEFNDWATKFKEESFVAQPKLDGLSLSIQYVDGAFSKAITRGDGITGEDISNNVRRMVGFKEALPVKFTGSLRCEILLSKTDLERINASLDVEGQYKNCRNAASGISRRLDGKFSQYLFLTFYDLSSNEPIENEAGKLQLITSMGLKSVDSITGPIDVIPKFFNSVQELRKDLNYNIDGIVVKLNSCKIQKEAGVLNNRPKGQIAWKFDPPGSATVLEKVTWEVGRTGVVTPLGHVTPVDIDGSTIKNVTLHNIAEIKRLGIGLGDTIMLIKANDIIPKVSSVIQHESNPILLPNNCPSCGSLLGNNEIQLFCSSDTCPAKNHSRIMHWIKTTGIENLGESSLDLFEKEGLVKSIKDLYFLKREQLMGFEGFKDKSSDKIISNINKTRTMPLSIFLAALGIPTLSTKTAEDLVTNFSTIENILKTPINKIASIKGYSDVSAEAIVSGLKKFELEILQLLEVITIGEASSSGVLAGKSFCFTGEMSKPRSYFQGLVTANGGKNDSSVTKTTTHLVCNENKGSSKTRKAQQYGTAIITEFQFLELVPEVPDQKKKLITESLF